MSQHWLAIRRNELKLNQLEFAERIGRSQSLISQWENGSEIPMLCNPHEAQTLADALEFSLLDLFVRAGYNFTLETVDKLEVPLSTLERVKKILDLSEDKRRIVLKMIDFLIEELPD